MPGQRSSGVELLDAGDYSAAEMRGNLADLRRYNRWFGGTAAAWRAFERLWRQQGRPVRVSLLDVATGSADIPASISRRARARGIELTCYGLDESADVLAEAAVRLDAGVAHLVRGRAEAIPLADRSVDYVLCSTFLHHLGDAESNGPLVAALAEMRRVARRGVIAIDLARSRGAAALVRFATGLTSANRLTRHDGPMSVARALTPAELSLAAGEAGLAGAVVRRLGPVRMAMTWGRPD